jgi:hypothetical protein
MKPKQDKWELVGHFGVDAGLCWIGDPCYVFHREEGPPRSIGKNWAEFCNLIEHYPTTKTFNFDGGHEGLGVCVSTGWGDGYYPVYARIKDGRVMQLYINFDE